MAEPFPLFHFDAETNRLIVDDSDSLARLLRKTWSPSGAKAVHSCPARWAGEKLIEEEPDPFGAADLGTAGHLVSELLHSMPADQRTPEQAERILRSLWADFRDKEYQLVFPAEDQRDEWEQAVRGKIAGLFLRENWSLGDDDTAALVARWDPGACDPETRTGRWHNQRKCERCAALRERWERDAAVFAGYVGEVVNSDAIPDPRTVDTIECERELRSEVNGVPFLGRIDRTDKANAGGVRIVDSKTAERPSTAESRAKFGDDHGDQLRLYAIAIEHVDGRMPDEVEIHYTATGEVYRAALTRRDLARVAREFRESWDEMVISHARNGYDTRESALCGWCPLVTVCPTATAKRKQDRSGKGQWALDNNVQVRTGDPGATPVFPDQAEECAPLTTEVKPKAEEEAEEREDRPARTEGATMSVAMETETLRLFSEGKRWTEKINGLPNANGIAMIACFGLAEQAAEILNTAKEGRVHPAEVTALAQVLLDVVLEVQVKLNSSEDLMDGLNVRLRGALHSALLIRPVPFGADTDGWRAWRGVIARIVESIARSALILFHEPIPADAWQIFVTEPEASEPVTKPERTPRRKPVPVAA